MRKKLLQTFIMLLAICLSAFTLTACGEKTYTAKETDNLIAELQLTIDANKTELDAKITALTQENNLKDAELLGKINANEQALTDLEEEYQAKIVELVEIDLANKKAIVDLDAKYLEEVGKLIAKDNANAEELAKLKTDYEAQLKLLQEKDQATDKAIKELDDKYLEEVGKLIAKDNANAEELAKLKTDYEAQLKLLQEKDQATDKAIKELDDKYLEEVGKLIAKDNANAEELAKLKANYEAQLKLLKDKDQATDKAIKELDDKYFEEVEKLIAKDNANAEELAKLKTDYEAQVKELKDKDLATDKAIKELDDKYFEEVEKLIAKDNANAEELAKLKTDYEAQIKLLQEKDLATDKAIADLDAKYLEEVEKLIAKDNANAEELAKLKTDYEAQVKELKDKDQATDKAIKELDNKYFEEVGKLQTSIAGLNAQMQANKENLEGQISELKDLYDAKLSEINFVIEELKKVDSSQQEIIKDLIDRVIALENHNHTPSEWKVIYNATCTQKGIKQKVCTDCSAVLEIEEISSLGHEFGDYVSNNNATYTNDGTKTAICKRAGCGETHTIIDTGTKLKSYIEFSTLSLKGLTVYGKVSNTTTIFDFRKEIKVFGEKEYIVALDRNGSNQILTKQVSLSIGDNKFYMFVMDGTDVEKVYQVTVRRKPIYTVEFLFKGNLITSQQVEEDALAVMPENPTIEGYTFTGWDFDFNLPITSNLTINATYTNNKDTQYKVEHYLEALNGGYILDSTDKLTGETDSFVVATPKNIAHFTPTTASGYINSNGSTVLKVYYTRNTYTVTFNGNGGTLSSGEETQFVKYEGSAVAPTYTKTGYTFMGFDKTFTNVSEDITISADWKINQYTITIVYGNGQPNKVITQDYDSLINEKLPLYLEKEQDIFKGWDNVLPSRMPAKNLVITAMWKNENFIVSDGKITGLTEEGKTVANLIIPESINGVKITSIGYNAFKGCTSLVSVELPDSITSIGSYAFENCTFLQSINIPKSVTKIGIYVFLGCENLKEIFIPESVTRIDSDVFYGCYSLKIYCEANKRPSGWEYYWNRLDSEQSCPVVWGYKG